MERPAAPDSPQAAGRTRATARVLRIIARLNVGGPAIHATLLTDRLRPLGYETTLVTGTEEAGEASYLDLYGRSSDHLVRLPALGREIRLLRDGATLLSLVRVVRRVRPHVVHTHTAKAGMLGRLAAWLCRVPVLVHTYHGHVLRGYFSPAKAELFTRLERGLARVTHQLIAVSPRVRADLLDLGIGRPDRFAVVPLGLDLERFAAVDSRRGELRREIGAGPDTPLVGIVARLVPIKAHEVFLAAAAAVAARLGDARFVVVGDGERRAELEAMAGALGLGSRCRFLGWRADLERIYADLDVVALTSRNEGSPVALIEAMAAGCPVVATRVGGVPDVVSDGEVGRLVPEGDAAAMAEAIVDLLGHGRGSRRLEEAARRSVAARYGADRLVHDIDALYRELLSARHLH